MFVEACSSPCVTFSSAACLNASNVSSSSCSFETPSMTEWLQGLGSALDSAPEHVAVCLFSSVNKTI